MDELKMFDIVYADFTNSKIGSEQSGIHPYIIIQNNMGNKYCPTVLGMSLTSVLKKEYMPTHSVMGVEPLRINSEIVAPALRDRYYWTNIPGIEPLTRKNVNLQDILTDGYTNREKGHCLVVVDCRPATTPVKMFHRYYYKGFGNLIFKNKEQFEQCAKYYDEHYRGMKAKDIPVGETNIFDGIRYLNQTEIERCQTIPEGYTKCLTRNEAADVCGDGWTVDVIAHIFCYMK